MTNFVRVYGGEDFKTIAKLNSDSASASITLLPPSKPVFGHARIRFGAGEEFTAFVDIGCWTRFTVNGGCAEVSVYISDKGEEATVGCMIDTGDNNSSPTKRLTYTTRLGGNRLFLTPPFATSICFVHFLEQEIVLELLNAFNKVVSSYSVVGGVSSDIPLTADIVAVSARGNGVLTNSVAVFGLTL